MTPTTQLGRLLWTLARGTDDELAEAMGGLLRYLETWSDDEMEVLGYIAERLDIGRERYGRMDHKGAAYKGAYKGERM